MIERVGGNSLIQVDVRVIVATNTVLQEEVTRQNFREDLYYRINVVSLAIPPLRERLADIEPLADHFLRQFNALHHRRIKGISKSALQLCLRYGWPGNVRELENVMEQAVILSPGDYLVPESLPAHLREAAIALRPRWARPTLDEALALSERQIVLETLERCKWSRQLTARALGISRTTLFNKMRRFQLLDPRRQPALTETFPDSSDPTLPET